MMVHKLLIPIAFLACFLQSCSSSRYIESRYYQARRPIAFSDHVTMIGDSTNGFDVAASIQITAPEYDNYKKKCNQFSLNVDHKLSKCVFLHQGISYFSNYAPINKIPRTDYHYNEFARGGMMTFSIGVIRYTNQLYGSSSFDVMNGFESIDIIGKKYDTDDVDEYSQWINNDAIYRVKKAGIGNTTHIGFNWKAIKIGFGMQSHYVIFDKDMIKYFDIKEEKYTNGSFTSYNFKKIGYINDQSFLNINPFISARILILKHLAITFQANFDRFMLMKGTHEYPRSPGIKLGMVYSSMSNRKKSSK